MLAEAAAARAAFVAAPAAAGRGDRGVDAGRELTAAGQGEDLADVTALDVATAVPVLAGGTFIPLLQRELMYRTRDDPAKRVSTHLLDEAEAGGAMLWSAWGRSTTNSVRWPGNTCSLITRAGRRHRS